MPNINIERIYGISNYFAFALAFIALVAALLYDGLSLWIPLIILAIPTLLFVMVVSGALFWSFYLTRKNNADKS